MSLLDIAKLGKEIIWSGQKYLSVSYKLCKTWFFCQIVHVELHLLGKKFIMWERFPQHSAWRLEESRKGAVLNQGN